METPTTIAKRPQTNRKTGILYGGSPSGQKITSAQGNYTEQQIQQPQNTNARAQSQQQDVVDLLLRKLKERRETSIFASVKKVANLKAKQQELVVKQQALKIEEQAPEKRKKRRPYVHY